MDDRWSGTGSEAEGSTTEYFRTCSRVPMSKPVYHELASASISPESDSAYGHELRLIGRGNSKSPDTELPGDLCRERDLNPHEGTLTAS